MTAQTVTRILHLSTTGTTPIQCVHCTLHSLQCIHFANTYAGYTTTLAFNTGTQCISLILCTVYTTTLAFNTGTQCITLILCTVYTTTLAFNTGTVYCTNSNTVYSVHHNTSI